MIKYLHYLSYVLRHKWYVGVECFKYGLYWRGLMHDCSKLLPDEFLPYTNYFYGSRPEGEGETAAGFCKTGPSVDQAFDEAWLRHQKRNRHHWQWFILQEDDGPVKLMPMTSEDVVEMVCDWIGAGKAQNNPTPVWEWFEHNRPKMKLHPITEMLVRQLLGEIEQPSGLHAPVR